MEFCINALFSLYYHPVRICTQFEYVLKYPEFLRFVEDKDKKNREILLIFIFSHNDPKQPRPRHQNKFLQALVV